MRIKINTKIGFFGFKYMAAWMCRINGANKYIWSTCAQVYMSILLRLPIGRIQYVLSRYVPWVNGGRLVKCTRSLYILAHYREHRTDETVGVLRKMPIAARAAKAKHEMYVCLYVVGDHYRTRAVHTLYFLFIFTHTVMYTSNRETKSHLCINFIVYTNTSRSALSSMHTQNSSMHKNNMIVRVFN